MKVITLAAVFIMALAINLQAAEADWDTTIAFGATLTSGNSDTLTSAFTAESVRKGTPNEISLSAAFQYGESDTDGSMETTVQNMGAAADYKRVYKNAAYGRIDISLLNDDIAQVDYRLVVGPAAGVYLIRNESTSLNCDPGIAMLYEEVDDMKTDSILLTFKERWEHKLADTAKLWQSLEVLPEADELDVLLINAEIGVEATLTDMMSLRVVIKDKYDSDPAEGIDENDISLIVSVGLKI